IDDVLAHPRELGVSGRTVLPADDHIAQRAEPDHGRYVDGGSQLLEGFPEVRESRVTAVARLVALVAWSGGRAILSDHDRRHALTHEGFRARVAPQRSIAVRVNVDETRRHCLAADVDLDRAALLRAAREPHDSPVAND